MICKTKGATRSLSCRAVAEETGPWASGRKIGEDRFDFQWYGLLLGTRSWKIALASPIEKYISRIFQGCLMRFWLCV